MGLLNWISHLIHKQPKSEPFTPDPNINKKALCIGINNYGGVNNLRGPINDAMAWSDLFKNVFKFNEVTTLLDNQATKENVKNAMVNLVSQSNPTDIIVVTYSGHGSNVKDNSGDEVEGKDECLVLYGGEFLIDDEIRYIIESVKDNTQFVIIADSCFSGTVTRSFSDSTNNQEEILTPKFMILPNNPIDEPWNEDEIITKSRMFRSIGIEEEDMKEILISGSRNTEVSFDSFMEGKASGVLSYYGIKILKETPNISYNEFYEILRTYLPSTRYPQTPQLEGKLSNRNRKIFS